MKYLLIYFLIFFSFCVYSQSKWSLDECIKHAKENNIDVLKQQLQNESFNEDIINVKGNFYPDASFNATQGFSLGNSFNVSTGVGQLESSFNSFSLSSSLSIFNGFANKYNLQKARLVKKKGAADLEQVYLNLALNIANNYLTVLFNKEIVSVAIEQVQISKQEVDRLEKLNKSALASASELLQMKATLSTDTKELQMAQNNLNNSKIELKELLDINYIANFDIEEVDILDFESAAFSATASSIYNEALKTNPLIESSQFNAEMTQKDIQIAKANFYPTLNLNYSYSSNYYHILGREDLVFNQDTQQFEDNGFFVQLNNNRTHYIGLILSVPIFNRFETKTNLNKAKIDLEIKEIELKNHKNQLRNKVEIAYNNVLTAKASLDDAMSALNSQKEAFYINQSKYASGLLTNFEFLKSKSLFIKAESDLVQAKYDYLFKIKVLNYYVNN